MTTKRKQYICKKHLYFVNEYGGTLIRGFTKGLIYNSCGSNNRRKIQLVDNSNKLRTIFGRGRKYFVLNTKSNREKYCNNDKRR